MTDDAGDARDPAREFRRPSDRPEMRIEDVVPVVGSEGLVAVLPQFDLAAERLERRGRVLPAERMHLDGQRRLRAEATDEFGVVDDYNELLRRGRHDLLAEQGAAHPFDQVELRVDLVRAVHRQVEPEALLQRGQRNPESLRLLRGREGRRHAPEVHTAGYETGDAREEVPRRRSAADTEDHSRLDVREGGLRGVP